ncbi:MAG TPA: VOC family protein [Terriglobales bacterium]|nr:VOC family protein [Terriglobales bacterium]
MSQKWYSRPVLYVSDVEASTAFYVKQLGFTEHWRYEEDGETWITQVDRLGCELILASPFSFSPQLPGNVGKGLVFISLDLPVLQALRADLEQRGLAVQDGRWGYRLMVVADPDGNQLYFPYPADEPSRGAMKAAPTMPRD